MDGRTGSVDSECPGKTQVDHIQPVTIQRAGFDQVHRNVARTSGEVTAQRRRNDGVGRRIVRENLRSRQALEIARHLQVDPWNRVRSP